MSKNTIILQGSSRSDGNTRKISDYLIAKTDAHLTDLNTHDIGKFDYQFRNSGDDFLPLVRKIVSEYESIVFATPVYWYSMSGIMKTFFDRISDLLTKEKATGRRFRGKSMAMVSCSGDSNRPDYFSRPFAETANYLGMRYLGDVHAWIEGDELPDEVVERLNEFAKRLI